MSSTIDVDQLYEGEEDRCVCRLQKYYVWRWLGLQVRHRLDANRLSSVLRRPLRVIGVVTGAGRLLLGNRWLRNAKCEGRAGADSRRGNECT